VQGGSLTPMAAVKKSFFRHDMVRKLQAQGLGKELRGLDLSTMEEEVVT